MPPQPADKNEYIVRHTRNHARRLTSTRPPPGDPGWLWSTTPPYDDAVAVFPTAEAAQAAQRVRLETEPGQWEVCLCTYALKWTNTYSEYAGPGGDVTNRDRATRYPTADAARASVFDPYCLVGATGPEDKIGWRVVRLIKRVK